MREAHVTAAPSLDNAPSQMRAKTRTVRSAANRRPMVKCDGARCLGFHPVAHMEARGASLATPLPRGANGARLVGPDRRNPDVQKPWSTAIAPPLVLPPLVDRAATPPARLLLSWDLSDSDQWGQSASGAPLPPKRRPRVRSKSFDESQLRPGRSTRLLSRYALPNKPTPTPAQHEDGNAMD